MMTPSMPPSLERLRARRGALSAAAPYHHQQVEHGLLEERRLARVQAGQQIGGDVGVDPPDAGLDLL